MSRNVHFITHVRIWKLSQSNSTIIYKVKHFRFPNVLQENIGFSQSIEKWKWNRRFSLFLPERDIKPRYRKVNLVSKSGIDRGFQTYCNQFAGNNLEWNLNGTVVLYCARKNCILLVFPRALRQYEAWLALRN